MAEIPGEVADWTLIQSEDGGSPLPGRTREWLDRHGFATQIWLAQVALDWMPCANEELGVDPRGIESELENADEDAARIRLA